MSTALDLFRAQQAAVEQVYARVNELAGLVGRLNAQVEQIVQDKELRAVLQDEQNWLEDARRMVDETRRWREEEARRYWPALIYRWIAALAFALVSAFAVGAGYGRVAEPFAAELKAIRPQADLGLFVEHRMSTMTPAERRQLDALMKWKRADR